LKSELAASQQKNETYEQQLEEKRRQMTELSNKLDSEITSLKADKSKLELDLKNAERAKSDLDERIKTLAAAALKFEETVGGMQGSLTETRDELDKARAEVIKQNKNLNEITASLEEKIAQLDSLSAEKKRLLEEKAKLEQQIAGKVPTMETSEPITPMAGQSATSAIETTSGAPLQGKISAIEGSLATISIGSADGVEKGMVFHVTRNDVFVCDIKISEVDTEVAAGNLQLVQQQPMTGDLISTTW